MIFGVWNPEKIWRRYLVQLTSLPVYCNHFTLGNPKKSFFNSINEKCNDLKCAKTDLELA